MDQNEETLKRSSVEKPLSIMDFYQHDMYSHLEKDTRRISQYALLHKESSLEAGDRLSVSIKTHKSSILLVIIYDIKEGSNIFRGSFRYLSLL